MAEIFTVAAVLLMTLAVAGSLTPMVPGALLSVFGILVYWYGTGFTRPDTWFLSAFVLTGLFTVAFDYLSGIIAAKFGGASTKTSAAAGIAGFLLFFVLGPIGILIGITGTVLVREYLVAGDARKSLRAAVYSGVGVLGSAMVQFVITFTLLSSFIAVLIL